MAVACNARKASKVAGHSANWASPVYTPASYSTKSPLKSTFSDSTQAMVSPRVWPGPGCQISTTTPPKSIFKLPWRPGLPSPTIKVGQVRPGTLSAPRNKRGKRSISLFMSAAPRSTINSYVPWLAMMSLAPSALKALAPNTRTAW